jgi:hypothetical protein
MTDAIERLRRHAQNEATYFAMRDMLKDRDAEIERLKAERDAATADFNEMRDMAVKEMARWAREAGASQAREAYFREALNQLWANTRLSTAEVTSIIKATFTIPSDDSALKEAVKQGQREILLKAANKLNYGDIAYTELRKMADEL